MDLTEATEAIETVKKIQKRKAFLKYIREIDSLLDNWDKLETPKKKEELDKAFNAYRTRLTNIEEIKEDIINERQKRD